MDDPEEAPARTRSLRTRKTRVDYSEDESEEIHYSQPNEKKRGSKRKAEVTIESLYCQENVKEVSPSSLETIFESPQKGLKGGRSKSSKILKNANEMILETQVMSVKKWKRFCSFVDYYRPSKQKTKARKDRAKKLKQLTGVKVPVGFVTDEALQTVLSVLSEDEDQSENVRKDEPCNDISSFYSGNVIRPDVEDASINDVIKNISTMQMITESCNEKDLMPKGFMEDMDEPFLFSSEKRNGCPPSQQKKSRRRSERFSGCLLPSSSRKIENVQSPASEMEEFSGIKSSNLPETIGDEKAEFLDRSRSEQIPTEEMSAAKNVPKRRNVLNDRKVVKKPKRLEPTLKRQNESKDEQCQKKRGNIQNRGGKTQSNSQSVDDDDDDSVEVDLPMRKDLSLHKGVENSSDITIQISEYQTSGPPQLADLSCSQVNLLGSVKGKKRGKRRVSGISRPLYRTIINTPSPEAVSGNHSKSLNHESDEGFASPVLAVNSRCTTANITTSAVTVSSVQNGMLHICPSPTSPCTAMAALSLQSDREVASNLKQRAPVKRTRRRSEQLTRASLVSALPPSTPLSTAASLPSQSSVICSTGLRNEGLNSHCGKAEPSGNVYDFTEDFCEKPEMSQGVQKRNRKRLSDVFSQHQLNPVVEEENDTTAAISLSRNKESVISSDAINSSPVPCLVSVDCKVNPQGRSTYAESGVMNSDVEKKSFGYEALQTKDPAFSEERSSDQLLLPETNWGIGGGIPPATSVVESKDPVDSTKRFVNMYNASPQQDVRNVGNMLKTSNLNCRMFEEGEVDSPIITGMIGNRASIRCGKVYCNKKSVSSSPIVLEHFGEVQTSHPRTFEVDNIGCGGGSGI